ncbi:MAG: alpha/beta fold hydrolase [Pyrinomonadaceae bacterium]|nr:alpha/beta fold hydrolase [Pyrinomonadaceae bacterium]
MSIIKVNGLNIGYDERGRMIDNSPLVFLHGVGSDKSVWREQLQHFGETRRTIAFDYAGYGDSDLPESDLSRGDVAKSILEAMDALSIQTAHFCGLSMGGVIALEIYKQQQNRVASLILADTFAKHPTGEDIVKRSLDFIKTNSMRDFATQRIAALMVSDDANVRAEVIETMSKIDKKSYAWATKAVWQADNFEMLPQINAPTLVICGDSDAPTPVALSEELASNIKRAKLVIIERAGHLSNLDNPAAFNKSIENFMVRIE